jgi:hypothetical protein
LTSSLLRRRDASEERAKPLPHAGDLGGNEEAQRGIRNEVSQLPRRDKQDSNLLSLKKAKNDPKVLWSLADQALRKDYPSLPASITGKNGPTTTPMEAAEVMNPFFVDKVEDLGKKALRPRAPEEAPKVPEEVPDVAGIE